MCRVLVGGVVLSEVIVVGLMVIVIVGVEVVVNGGVVVSCVVLVVGFGDVGSGVVMVGVGLLCCIYYRFVDMVVVVVIRVRIGFMFV